SALQVPPRSAYRVDQDLVAFQRQNAQTLYGESYRIADGVDLRPAIDPILQRWAAVAASPDTPRPMAALINKALRNFQSSGGEPVQSLRSFQRSKEFLDDTIETLVNSANGKQRARAGLLGEIQRDLLAAVDAIPNVGPAYSTARGAFSSSARMREALEAGRAALREGSEVSADAYRAYAPGEQQMFRVGLADSIEQQMARQKRGADVTQLFQTPRTQELLQEVMPQDTAQRIGGVIQSENAMTRSNNVVFGNSATAQRMADDQAFNQMSEVIDTLRNRSVTGAALNYAARVLNKALGFRADEATQIARTLFTADRGSIDDTIAQITRRMGENKAAQFAQMMRAYQSRVVGTASGAAGAAQQPPRRREYTVEQQMPGGSSRLPPDPKPMPPR
ncbi:MAG: hypothetical protein EBT83_16210, partial [Betaproteobacteria bacterium]|nr:hypothetical protein [Betaproteobacteria bacterium]